MSVLDRVHKREQTKRLEQTEDGSPGSGQSLIPAAKPAVIKRLEYVVNTLHEYIADNDDSGTMARFSFITKAMIEEIGEELVDRDEETLQTFMAQIGEVISWIGHGDNGQLPENVRNFVEPRTEIEAAS